MKRRDNNKDRSSAKKKTLSLLILNSLISLILDLSEFLRLLK